MNLPTVLLLNDEKDTFSNLKKILERQFFILFTSSPKEAAQFIKTNPNLVSAVCVSADLGQSSVASSSQSACVEFLRSVNSYAWSSHIPIIVSAKRHSDKAELEAMENGAIDFIHEPYDDQIILRRFQNVIRMRETSLTMKTVSRDDLTGLYSKPFFMIQAQKILEARGDKIYDFICIDIERFKLVNDICGIEIGNKILRQVGQLLFDEAKKWNGIVGHFSEDIFFALSERPESFTDEGFKKIIDRLNEIDEVKRFNLHLRLVFGIYQVKNMRASISVMCDRAQMAAEKIKGRYGVYYCYYDDSIRKKMINEQKIAGCMETALRNREFLVYYQPKYDLATETIAGAEALVRWRSKEMGMMSPGDFVPLFEKNGFITRMDMYIWEKVCIDLRAWIAAGNKAIPVSVNVSRADLLNPNLVSILSGLVKKYDIPAKYLHLEITESAYTEDPEQIVKIIYELRKREFLIEMDDFGSGYSSLNMLSEMPIDILKLDMTFVRNEMERTNGRGILSYIISLANWLNLKVVAEGVETKSQVAQLKDMGCSFVQGYYFSKPLDRDEFFSLLRKSRLTDMDSPRTEGVENLTKANIEGALFGDSEKQNGVMLVVDDVESSRIILSEMFKKDFEIAQAANGAEAWKYIEANHEKISIVLLDLIMPVMNGYEVLKKIRADDRTKTLPVIVTSQGEADAEQKAFELNADDFLQKPYNANIMRHRVRNVVAHSFVKKLEQEKTLTKKLLEIERQAHSDFLTGLDNRTILEKSVGEFFVKSASYDAVFISLDIDDFKTINDTFGHMTGDDTIKKVANILVKFFDKKTCVCRMGGDEFAVFIPKKYSKDELELMLTDLNSALQFDVERFKVTCSMGVAVAPDYGMDYQTLYNNSDMALLAAKRYGKNQFNVFAGQSVLPSYVFYRNMDWLLDEFSDAVYVCYADSYDLIYVNKVACKICGKEKKNCIGKKCYNVLFDRDQPCDFCIREDGVFRDFVQKNIFPRQGESTCYTMRAKVVNWSGFDARIQYMRESTFNSNLAHTLEGIANSDGDALNRMPDGTFKIEATLTDDTIYGANKSLYELFGYDEEDFKEKFKDRFGNFVSAQEKERVFEEIRTQSKERGLVFLKFCVECVDETLRQVIACGRVIKESEEKTWVFMSVVPAEFLRPLFSED
ncbi:MAG: EAL domain-containing protein [Treponema sp.]|nr:EAL domain-containing protein [Treponema sp.]